MSSAVQFYASVAKVQTLADGGIRLTLDLPESAVVQMAELAAFKIHGVAVDVICAPITQETDERKPDGNGRKQTKPTY